VAEIWLGGGVAANVNLRKMIRETIKNTGKKVSNSDTKNPKLSKQKAKIIFRTPFTKRLCMDNAAMIGLVASYKFERKEFVSDLEELERSPRLI